MTWLIRLVNQKGRTALYLVRTNGSEYDAREIARCLMGHGWNSMTADRTSIHTTGRYTRLRIGKSK